ncbi:nuclease EXOG, mitochondrial-like isoform X2 [Centroberyx affinis]|uniref:nuclease EXOG, mitochondrial-like isoform X2 n=1 Tax=Centroberyx affinis TaxID=166261 RepID=UPI003A5C2E7F
MAARVKLFGFVGGFVCGAAVSTGSCLTVLKLYRLDPEEQSTPGREDGADNEVQQLIGRFGLPETGAEVRYYANHALSYDQARKTPRWVAEHLTNHKLRGKANRKHCKFRADPAIPACFSAGNEDYLGSGWSRGHMAPAGDNKQSEQSMAETFYLSNIIPQNYENNAGFWNRLEMYCRELTQRFQDVWVVSGPLVLPREEEEDGRKMVSYQVIGKDAVAVPTHLFKAVLVQNSTDVNNDNDNDQSAAPVLALGAFVVPNRPIGFERPLTDFQVSLPELERASGLRLYPGLPRPTADLCELDGCQLMGFKEFTLYLTGRKVSGARSLVKLEQFMSELSQQEIQPDDYLNDLYLQKKKELLLRANREQPEGKTGAG